jgi:ATP-dependent Clp protease adaptor protein ClpS
MDSMSANPVARTAGRFGAGYGPRLAAAAPSAVYCWCKASVSEGEYAMPKDKTKSAKADPTPSKSPSLLPAVAEPRTLPMFKVILHNDDKNFMEHVADSIVLLTPLNRQDAIQRTIEAHYTGCALLLVTHKERAELYVEQFQSCGLVVTIEPDE